MPNLLPLVSAFLMLFSSIATFAQGPAKKPEPTTGTVSGSVTCADTNAPARFAVVTLERIPEEVSASGKKEKEEGGMNPTTTTDMEGRFFLDKVPAGHYYVVGRLAGYLNPLARFSEQQLQKMSDETRKELAKAVPMVSVGGNQGAAVSLRLEHASELSGTVLYDDGSPAVSLEIKLLRKDKDGKLVDLKLGAVNGVGFFGSSGITETDDRGHYRMIGAPPGEYAVSASLPTQTVSLAGLFGSESVTVVGQGGNALSVYYGDTFRKKDAKIAKVGEGDQVGGLDITIAGNGLHSIRGTAVAKLDGHPVSRAHVELLYADDRELIRTAEVGRETEDGSFEFSYVPAGQYILRLVDAIDVEKIERHEFNSNFTDEKLMHRYDVSELPLTVQGDMNGVELAAPEIAGEKVAQQ